MTKTSWVRRLKRLQAKLDQHVPPEKKAQEKWLTENASNNKHTRIVLLPGDTRQVVNRYESSLKSIDKDSIPKVKSWRNIIGYTEIDELFNKRCYTDKLKPTTKLIPLTSLLEKADMNEVKNSQIGIEKCKDEIFRSKKPDETIDD